MFKRMQPKEIEQVPNPILPKIEPKKEVVKEVKEIIQVVNELPTQKVRRYETKDANGEDIIVNYMTIEEYLTIQANAE